MSDETRQDDSIGALWPHTSKKGVEYLKGTVAGQKVVVFRNKQQHERQPAWRVYADKPKASEQDAGW